MIYHRISVAKYDEMIRTGVLSENDRVELIRGAIHEKMPIGPEHSASVKALIRAFIERLGSRATVGSQDPIVLPDSEPEPDVSLAQPRADNYASGHPKAAEIFAVVEVADSSLDFDRDEKLPMYADGAIPECWIVNLIQRQIEVYRMPADGTYASQSVARPGDEIELLAFPGIRFAVNEILPQ
jgi:Uma2 family endonuclease